MVNGKKEIVWQPWGEEAFATAKRLGRPILLDIGATWCHWCHVMEETTYSDEEVRKLVEEYFIPIKVDRDRNPEVDRRYQYLVGSVTGEGGWPLTALLTPDGDLITGGTYFPPKDAGGRPGLRRILRETLELWKGRGKDKGMDTYRLGIGESRTRKPTNEKEIGEFMESVAESLRLSYDEVSGGLGVAPKFPHPVALSLAFALGHARSDTKFTAIASESLRRMGEGGIFDQLGGGFHRYSVDRGWHIPHFEKLSADNAFHLKSYLEAYSVAGDIEFLKTARATTQYVLEVLNQASGGFASSMDADRAPGDDGSYFTWSKKELSELLSREEYKVIQRRFGIGTEGGMPHDPEQNVLFRLFSVAEIASSLELSESQVEEILSSAISKMVQARKRRSTPQVDTSLYAWVNGYLAGSMAQASRVLDLPEALLASERAMAHFCRAELETRGVPHEVTKEGSTVSWGLLEDNVAVLSGLLDLAEVTGKRDYLQKAKTLLGFISQHFQDGSGLLADVAPGVFEGHIPSAAGDKRFPLEDSPLLSPNSSYALSCLRYAGLAEDPEFREVANGLFTAMVPYLKEAGFFAAGAALTGLLLGLEPVKVVVFGSDPAADALFRSALATYLPRKLVLKGDGFGAETLPAEARATLTGKGSKAMALVCTGNRCLPPAFDEAELRQRLAEVSKAH